MRQKSLPFQVFSLSFPNPFLPQPPSLEQLDLSIYWAMRTTDPTVRAGIEFLRLSVLSRLVGYRNPQEPRIEEFVRQTLEGMEGKLHDVVYELLSALWAGFAVAEIVYRPQKGRMAIKKVKVLNPVSIYPSGIEIDEKGRIGRIVQKVGLEEIELPLERTILWSFGGEFQNPWGSSLLRPAYQHWLIKQALIRLWNTHLERQATPLGIVNIPQAEMPAYCPIHGKQERAMEVMRHIMEDLRNRSSLILSGGAEVSFEKMPAQGELFESAIRYHDVQILRALLIPSLLVSEAEYGTRAQAVVHQTAFQMMIEGIIRELKAVLEEQLFRRLVELNFGEARSWGEVVFKSFADTDYATWADVLSKLTKAGWLSPKKEEEMNKVREIIGWR